MSAGDPIYIKFSQTAAEAGRASGGMSDGPTMRLHKSSTNYHSSPKGWYYMSPEPKISYSTTPVVQGNTLLGYETSVTLSAWALPSGDATIRARRVAANLGNIQSFFKDCDLLTLLASPTDTTQIISFNILTPTFSVEETDFFGAVRFSIQFNGFDHDSIKSVSGVLISDPTGSDQNGYGLSQTQAIPLASFSDTFSYEPDSSLGFSYDDPTGQVYRFTRTISATARPSSNASINSESTFNKNAVSGAKAFVDMRRSRRTFDPYYVTNEFKLIEGVNAFNMTQSHSTDLASLTYSVTITGLYCDGDYGNKIKASGAFETFSVNVQKDESHLVSVSVDGSLTGYAKNGPSDNQNTMVANASRGAYHILNTISGGGKFGYNSVVFKRAQEACGAPLNATPKSLSIGDSTQADGKITYNVTYDNRPVSIISGALTESITINDTYPTDVYASIQVMGKRGGPVFQYMNTTTHFERDLTIEVTLDTQKIAQNVGAPYGRLMNYKPSIDSNTRGTINRLVNDLAPGGKDIGYCMLKQCNESWSPKDGRYTLNVGWIYK
jgi:hypothetical protein